MNKQVLVVATLLIGTALSSGLGAQPGGNSEGEKVTDASVVSRSETVIATETAVEVEAAIATETTPQDQTIATLENLATLKGELEVEIGALSQRLQDTESTVEKQDLLETIQKLKIDLNATEKNLQEVATGSDIANLRSQETPAFNFQEELFSLLEPAISEMKDMTSQVRLKTAQRDRIEYYSEKLPTAKSAISSLEALLARAEDPTLATTLETMLGSWKKQLTFLNSEIQSATIQLEKLEQAELSLAETSQGYLKSFFEKRGLYLGRAILVVAVILLLSGWLHRLMERFIPGYEKAHRSFKIRLLDLSHRIITGLLVIIGPMIVFYLAEDWLLFSLGIIILLGAAVTLRHAIPKYWQLVQLFLNIGTVREGERIEINGFPWLVQKINFYTLLKNPTSGLVRRVKIDDLVDLRSRATQDNEAWFPCRPGDWIRIDDTLAKVVGISEEMTRLVLRGGAQKTYLTSDFLGAAPVCLSNNFRIRQTVGVSYSLQAQSTSTICTELRAYILQRIEEEGYGEQLMNLSVEFEYANASSLDIAVIADYKGELAQAYNRLNRSTQRWCVDACTLHGWEIPFMQVTLNNPTD